MPERPTTAFGHVGFFFGLWECGASLSEETTCQQGNPIIARFGKDKLSDAIRQLRRKPGIGKGGNALPTSQDRHRADPCVPGKQSGRQLRGFEL